jgi:amino acid transporter
MFGKSLRRPIWTGSEDDIEAKAITESNVQVGPEQGHGVVQIVDSHEENDLSRSLSQRHIQMIALAGAIVRSRIYRLL